MRLCLLMLLTLLAAPLRAEGPRYYMVVRDVQGPPGAPRGDEATQLARKVFEEELLRRPEVTLSAAGLPAGGEALPQELKARKLKGYQLTLRLLNNTRALHPPPRGKQYRVLERSVRLTLIGTTLPGDQLAVGGDGESTVQADVGATVSPQKDQELLRDALKDAIGQAVQQAIRKLDKGGIVPRPETKRAK